MSFDGRLLAGITVLAAVVQGRSFVRAGEALGITTSGVSRSIARLEERLGIRLLDRTPRSVALTDEGKRFYEQVGPLLSTIEDAANSVSGSAGAVRGRLRVDIDPYFSRLILSGKIGSFLAMHPGLVLEMVTREHVSDLVADGIDVAVRFGEPASDTMIARKLLETRVLTLASPQYVKKHGKPKHPTDLASHECIQFLDPIIRMGVPGGKEGRFRQDKGASSTERRWYHDQRMPCGDGRGADPQHRRPASPRLRQARRSLSGLAGRGLSPVCAAPLAAAPAGQGAGLHRVCPEGRESQGRVGHRR
jgi:DNA-binding transcriptional LysR family regulator